MVGCGHDADEWAISCGLTGGETVKRIFELPVVYWIVWEKENGDVVLCSYVVS